MQAYRSKSVCPTVPLLSQCPLRELVTDRIARDHWPGWLVNQRAPNRRSKQEPYFLHEALGLQLGLQM